MMDAEDIIAVFGSEMAAGFIADELRSIPCASDPIANLLRAIEIATHPTFERDRQELAPAAELLQKGEPYLYAAIPSSCRFLLRPTLRWFKSTLRLDDLLSNFVQDRPAQMLAAQAAQTLRIALLEGPDSWARGARLTVVGEQPDAADQREAA